MLDHNPALNQGKGLFSKQIEAQIYLRTRKREAHLIMAAKQRLHEREKP